MRKSLDQTYASLPTQGLSPREAGMVGKEVGKSKRRHFKDNIVSWFTVSLATIGIAGLVAIDTKLLAGTMGETIWDEFGEDGLAVYVPLALVMIAAFAHRLISKQSDEELKRSWLGRLVKRLCVVLVLSIALLFSVTILKSLYPSRPAVSDGDDWGVVTDVTRGIVETIAVEIAAVISPFAEMIFALVSGGILVITAFLLMILMDWWYGAVKTLVVSRAQHHALMRTNEELKKLRKRYSPVASTINTESRKTPAERKMEFALYLVSQGNKALAAQRTALSDRKLKRAIKAPQWQEIDELPQNQAPGDLLKQRKDFARSLNIETILNALRRKNV